MTGWARANAYQVGDRVLWLDKKTRRGRCMKLKRQRTGPCEVIKRLSEVVYQIKYCGAVLEGTPWSKRELYILIS